MRFFTYCLYIIGVMGIINTLIRFSENTHKYGPYVGKAVYPAFSEVIGFVLHPMTLSIAVWVFICTLAVITLVPSTSVASVGPDGTLAIDFLSGMVR